MAAAAHRAEAWLAPRRRDGGVSLAADPGRVLFHGHCHQKALVGTKGSADALKLIPGLDLTVLDAGCCGMAGAFGYEKDHYGVSVAVANLALVPALNAAPDAAVVATGTSCRHQVRDLTGRRAMHPLEVLADAAGV